MKKNYFLESFRRKTKLFALSLFLFFGTNLIFGQQNISQSPRKLEFNPSTSGQLTIWDATASPMESLTNRTEYTVEAYDGKRRFVLYNEFSYKNVVSGSSALLSNKIFYNGSDLIELPAGTRHSMISGKNLFWVNTDSTILNYLYNDFSTIKTLSGSNSGKKLLLNVTGNRVTYLENGKLYNWNVDNSYATQLSTGVVSNFYSDSLNQVWTEFDGHDVEVMYYNGIHTTQVTNDQVPNKPLHISGNKILWTTTINNVENLVFFTDLAYESISSSQFPTYKNVSIVNGKVVLFFGGAVYFYNGHYFDKLDQQISDYSFIYSKEYALWAKTNPDKTISYFTFDGYNKKLAVTLPSYFSTFLNNEEISGHTLVLSTGYHPSEIFKYDLLNGNYSNYKLNDVALTNCNKEQFFNLPINAKDTITPGITGLNFEISYDTNLFVATGKGTLQEFDKLYGAYGLNDKTPGKVIVNLYLNGAPAGYFSKAVGTLFNVQFKVKIFLKQFHFLIHNNGAC